MTMKHLISAALAVLTFACAPAPVAAQIIRECGTTAIAKAEANDRTKLGLNADCFGRAKAIAASAEAMRRDRIAALTPVVLPPVVSPPTVPAFNPTPAIAPTLDGVAPIASGLDTISLVQPAWGTGDIPAKEGDEGAFRFLCAPTHNAYDDPIVYPGQLGKSHLHTFFGNTKADGNSTYASLRTSGDSSCNNLLNRSAYWIAAMMNGHGKVVMPDWLQVYYKRIASDDPRCKIVATACRQLPRGLRYVFGYNMQNPAKNDPATARWWNCDGPGAVSGHFPTLAAAAAGCPVGARIGAIVVAPNCWNGTELDSADHRSHMAWQEQNGFGQAICPKSHPYLVAQFQLQAWYTVDATLADWFLSSDRMPGMTPAVPGTTLHADWFGAWEDSILTLWHLNCIDKLLSCAGGDLGNGTQIKTSAGYEMPHGRPLLDPPAMPAMAGMSH